MKKKYLIFECRGEYYVVNELGHMIQEKWFDDAVKNGREPNFSGQWLLKGVSYHHWTNHINVRFEELWKSPNLMYKGIVWDYDHGSTRIWGGSYRGKMPRCTGAFIKEM